MTNPKSTFVTCCLWLTILAFAHPAFCGESAEDEQCDKVAVLDALVGSWGFRLDAEDGFSARLKCRWILDRQFLEIEAYFTSPGQAETSWRTLLRYDRASDSYREWKFSDNGEVSTAQGAWNEKTSTLKLAGRTPSGNEFQSSFELIDDKTMVAAEVERLSEKERKSIRFTLRRAK